MFALNSKFKIKGNKTILLHSLVGVIIGYFLLHPASMVIHWFEMNDSSYNSSDVSKVFLDSIFHSFSLHMMPMSIAFSLLGLFHAEKEEQRWFSTAYNFACIKYFWKRYLFHYSYHF